LARFFRCFFFLLLPPSSSSQQQQPSLQVVVRDGIRMFLS